MIREQRAHDDGREAAPVVDGAAGKVARTARLGGGGSGRGAGPRGRRDGAAAVAGPSPLEGVALDEPYSLHLGQGGAAGAAAGAAAAGLPAGVDYEHVPGTLSFRARAAWLASGTPAERNLELLEHLRAHGPLAWASPARLAEAARSVRLSPDGGGEVTRVTFTSHLYAFIGLPPGVEVAVSGRADGLSLAVRAPGLDVPPGTQVPMTAAQVATMARALEDFTGLVVPESVRVKLAEVELEGRGGPGALVHDLSTADLETLFGREAYRQWAAGRRGSAGDASPRPVGAATSNLSAEELERVRAWLAAHLPAGGDGGAVVDRLLLSVIEEIEASPHRAKILAALQAGGGGGGALDAGKLRGLMNAAVFAAEAAAAEVTLPGGAGSLPPVWHVPAPVRIQQLGGRVVSGEPVPFRLDLRVPPELLTPERLDELRLRPFTTAVEWVFERADGAGDDELLDLAFGRTRGQKQVRHHHYTGEDDAPVEMRFLLAPGEQAAVWRVTAFVRHSHFQPAIVRTEVEVRDEEALLLELEQRAAGDLGIADAYSTGRDFDTGFLNDKLGKGGTDFGRVFRGRLPDDFAARTPEQRAATRAREMDDLRALIGHLQKNDRGGNQAAIAAARRHLADLERADRAVKADAADGWVPFELRGSFLSKARGVADGELQLYGSARVTGAMGLVMVQVRDLSRRFDGDDRAILGLGAGFEAALEQAFVTLCKAYPAGTVFVYAQVHDDAGLAPTTQAIGFELETGSFTKDLKEAVFDPVVNTVVNLAGMAAMIFVPGSAAIVLPALVMYSATQTVDQLHREWIEGRLTGKNLTLGLTAIGLDLLPFLGRARALAGSRRGLLVLEGVDLAGEAIYMTAAGLEQARVVQEQHVGAMAGLYRQLVELQQAGNPADPRLRALEAEFEERARKVRSATVDAFAAMVEQRAIFAAAKQVAHGAARASGVGGAPAADAVAVAGGPNADRLDLDADPRVRAEGPRRYRVDAVDLAELHGSARRADGAVSELRVDPVKGRASFELAGADGPVRIEATLRPALRSADELRTVTNRIVGQPVASLAEGQEVLRSVTRGDLGALARLGVEVPPDLRLDGVEFGLGALPDGRHVVVRGDSFEVDWSGLPGVVPLAHTHPLTEHGNHPRVVGEDEIALVRTVAVTADPLMAREVVFPSAADIAMMGGHGIDEHVVFTNLVVRQGTVAAPDGGDGDGPRLEWHILGAKHVGHDAAVGHVFEARVIGVAGGREVVKHQVWATQPASGPGSLYMRSPLPAPAAAEVPPPSGAEQRRLAARQAELASALGGSGRAAGEDGGLGLTVLSEDAFAARFRSERARAAFVLEDGRPHVYARPDASVEDVRHETDHLRQLEQGPMGPTIRRLYAGGLHEWDALSTRDRVELFRHKLAVELDQAEQRLVEAEQAGEHGAVLAQRAALGNLRALQAEVDALTDVEVSEMSAGHRAMPDFLRDPAWLFAKERTTVGQRPDRYAVIETAPRVMLPREGQERSPGWTVRSEVLGVYRVGDEWREVMHVTSDEAGTVSVLRGGKGGGAEAGAAGGGEAVTVVVTDARGKKRSYALEPGAELCVADGDRVLPGDLLAKERNKRYRLVEIEQAGGKELREEVFASDGHWQQRGSESSRRGAIMEHAARLQLDAQLAADGIKPVGAAGPDGAPAPVTYRRLTHQRGGGGFDDIVVIFSGPPDRPQAFIRIREVKDYPDRHVPLADFSAIRGENLRKNMDGLREQVATAKRAADSGRALHDDLAGLTSLQLEAIADAITFKNIQIEVVLGPTTMLGREGARGSSVLRDLRNEIKGLLEADVLKAGNLGIEHVAVDHAEAAAAAEREP